MTTDYNRLSDMISLRPFLNSFLRDYSSEVSLDGQEYFQFKTNEGTYKIFFKKFSFLGAHEYELPIYLNEKEVSPFEFVNAVVSHFSNSEHIDQFMQKLNSSMENIKQIFEFNKSATIENYIDSENLLLLGHPFHPYPKCKMGMKASDLIKYAPEFSPKVHLEWIEIDERFISDKSVLDKLRSLALFDLGEVSSKCYVPMHPWQLENIVKSQDFDDSMILSKQTGRNAFHVQSSMRTLYHEDSPFILKFSMDLTLTNSIRHLQSEESIRGSQIESVLRQEGIANKYENFEVLYEPFYLGLKSQAGEVLPNTIVQFRENFGKEIDLDQTFLLASLCEINPLTNQSKLDSLIGQVALDKNCETKLAKRIWFNQFLTNIIDPFLKLACNDGVLLGAHLQNIIVQMQASLPKTVIFRDCQGTGFSKLGYEAYSAKYDFIKNSRGNILDQDDVNKVFGYYLVVNTIFGVISSLAHGQFEEEKFLTNDFRTYIYNNRKNFTDLSFIDYVLNSPFLFQKGNMRCSLKQINENTASEPWQIYNKIQNPLKALREVGESVRGEVYRGKTKKGKSISFRVLEQSDLDIFHSWHHKKFVSEFWELDKSKEELSRYIDALLNSSYQLPLILELDNEPVGYFETYYAYDDRIAPYCNADIYDRGIHLLIGEEKYLRTGIVLESIFHVSKFLLEDNPRTQKVWGEPRSDNASIIRIAERLPGWRVREEFDFPHKRARLLELDKELFYKELHEF